MSFYQPSLSLYDVLDALTNKAGARGDYEDNIYGGRQPQRRAANQGYDRYDPFAARRQGYVPGSYYYSVPNASYYQPVYYTNEDAQPQRRPTHYHPHRTVRRTGAPTTASRRAVGPTSGDDVVGALLSALAGGNSDIFRGDADEESQRQATDDEQENDEQEQAAALAAAEEALANQYSEEEKERNDQQIDEETAEQGEDASDEYNEDYNMHNNEEQQKLNKTTSSVDSEKDVNQKDKLAYEPSGFRSPVPAPLQVSNPELRLDLPFSPEVNVYDTPEQYVVVLALPGTNSKEFKIDFHPSSHELLIKGAVDNKIGIDKKYVKISELKYGDFERSVEFPVLPRIKDEEIKASYFNGLLQIKVPKIPQDANKPQPKKRIIIEDVPDEELVFETAPRNL